MRALYSLLTRLRMLYALVQGTVAFVQTGWAALTPMQLLTLGLVLCIVLRVLTPAPPPARRGPAVAADHLLDAAAAASAVALQVAGTVGFCASGVKVIVLIRIMINS